MYINYYSEGVFLSQIDQSTNNSVTNMPMPYFEYILQWSLRFKTAHSVSKIWP